MNERIKELAKRAGFKTDRLGHLFGSDDIEKFAELIILECSTRLRNCANAYNGSDTDADYMEAMLHSADIIKDRFGVK